MMFSISFDVLYSIVELSNNSTSSSDQEKYSVLSLALLVCFLPRDISSFEKFNEARRTQRNPREQLAVEGTIAGSMFCLLEHAQSEISQLRLR